MKLFSFCLKPVVLLCMALFMLAPSLSAQKYLLLDRYNTKRIRLYPGDEIWFKQKGNPTRYHDYIQDLQDSVVVLGSRGIPVRLDEFKVFYFPNRPVRALSAGGTYIAGGFLFAAAVEPLVSEAFYDAQESATIGASAFAFAQLLRIFYWNKFKLNNRSRIRIMDTGLGQPPRPD